MPSAPHGVVPRHRILTFVFEKEYLHFIDTSSRHLSLFKSFQSFRLEHQRPGLMFFVLYSKYRASTQYGSR